MFKEDKLRLKVLLSDETGEETKTSILNDDFVTLGNTYAWGRDFTLIFHYSENEESWLELPEDSYQQFDTDHLGFRLVWGLKKEGDHYMQGDATVEGGLHLTLAATKVGSLSYEDHEFMQASNELVRNLNDWLITWTEWAEEHKEVPLPDDLRGEEIE